MLSRTPLSGRLGTLWRPLVALTIMLGLVACGDSDASSVEDNRRVVTRFVEEFKNNANHDIVDELFSTDFVHHLADPGLPPGRAVMKLLGQSIVAGFPDVHVTVEDLLADGDKIIERTTARATHTGEFNGISATGNKVAWTEIHIYRLKNEKIVELWSEIDLLGLLGQLGAVPGPA